MREHQSSSDIVDLLRRARQFVFDGGCDEDDMDVHLARVELLEEMDAALFGGVAQTSSGTAKTYSARDHFLNLTDQSNWPDLTGPEFRGYKEAMDAVHQGVMDFWPELTGTTLDVAQCAGKPVYFDKIANIISDYYDEDDAGRWRKCAEHIAQDIGGIAYTSPPDVTKITDQEMRELLSSTDVGQGRRRLRSILSTLSST